MSKDTPLPNPTSPPQGSFVSRLLKTRNCLRSFRNWKPTTGALREDEVGKPFVSIMVITYNHKQYIGKALDSILMQERDFSIEINVIDDASTDGTQAIVREYAQRFPGLVNCYFNLTNVGHIATQLNTIRGFQTLRGRYFALLEGDDYWTDPKKLAKQISFLEKHSDYVACAHPVMKVFDEGGEPEHFLPDEFWLGRDADIVNLVRMDSVFHLSSIVYRNVFAQTPPACLYDEFSHEVTISALYGMYGKFYCMYTYMSAYRVHGNGTFSTRSEEQIWHLHLQGIRRFAFYTGQHALLFAWSVNKLTRYVLTRAKKIDYSANTITMMRVHFLVSTFIGLFGRTGLFKYKKHKETHRNFRKALAKEMALNSANFHEDNWESAERGPEPEGRSPKRYHPYIRWLCPSLRYRRRAKKFKKFGYLYNRLEDSCSKELLVKLMAFRAMGHRSVKLPRNNPDYWRNLQKIENLETIGSPIPIESRKFSLQLRDFRPLGYNICAYSTPARGSYIFLQRQYALQRKGAVCRVEPGEIVIDAGAYWGETSLYFASLVGESGRVISYEFMPSSIAVFEKNTAANPQLAERITVVPNPIWSVSGEILYYLDCDGDSRVSFKKQLRTNLDVTKSQSTTIDTTVSRLSLPRVDFIKLDIDGAELHALKGAEKTLSQHHPKLAISLSNSLDDFENISRYLDSLSLEYKFYLDHHTIYENETVLFGVPTVRKGSSASCKASKLF